MRERIEPSRSPKFERDAPSLPAVPYLNVLSISTVLKRVPYDGTGVRRPDGGANFGFINSKVHPERIDSIPELVADPAMRSLMEALARPETGVFAIACDSRTIVDERGCRNTGYVEFAWNCGDRVTDPAQYFRLFHHFDGLLRRYDFSDAVSFQWEICPTRFMDAGVDGFAADVRVDTGFHPEVEASYACWGRALAALETALGNVPLQSGRRIYSRES